MSKQVALICKGFKSLEGSNDLKYLDNSVKEIATVLDSYWSVEEPYIVSDSGALKRKIENLGEDFDEFLFYYVGHGIVENDKFYIVGSDNDRINLKDILLLTEQWNKKVTIVLDACYSGQFINEWDNKIKYEIFTASDTKVAYEDPTYEMAFFTYNFCRAIQKNNQYEELSVENIYDEINDIVATRQKCTHHRVKSYGYTSNVISRCHKVYSISKDLNEPTAQVKSSPLNQIFLIFNEDNTSTRKYHVEVYIQYEDEFESNLIEFTFTNIYDEDEQEKFIKLLVDEFEDSITIHFIIAPELFLMNFKQWKYNGNELVKRYHILLHNKDRYNSKSRKYKNMIESWQVLFEAQKDNKLSDALLVTSDDSTTFDTRLDKMGVCFKQSLSNCEVISNTLDMAKVGVWQCEEGILTEYHTWVDGNLCLKELNETSRQCDHVALLWDDMSLLEKLKGRKL